MSTTNIDELLLSCEQEKLHLSGMIQPFGALLVVDENLKITHYSKNVYKFFDIDIDDILKIDINSLIPNLFEQTKKLKTIKEPYLYFRLKDKSLYLKISKVESAYVIDIQKIGKNILDQNIEKTLYNLYITPDTKENYDYYIQTYLNIVSKTIKFDRVMIYQFQDDFSGKVIAENILDDSYGSYLGLRFPSSDIPKIARDLYMLNPSRIIANVDAKNIDIVSLNNTTPDLTYSDTRSVSPVHVEYLKNMGVKASFSIPIIISNNLWGLLACHHFSNKVLDPYFKDRVIEQTKLFSLGINNYQAKEKLNYFDLIDHKINDMIDTLKYSKKFEDDIITNQEIFMNFISSDGFALVMDSKVLAFGNLPDNDSFITLDKYFLEYESTYINSDSISMQFDKNKYLGPSGVLCVKLKIDGSIYRCYWFRNEYIHELYWAGNPDKPVIENAGALRLSPRRSFEKFVEIKRGYSKKFTSLEVAAMLRFSNIFFKYLNKVR